MPRWNPSSPITKGSEWYPSRSAPMTLAPLPEATSTITENLVGVGLIASVTESIKSVIPHLNVRTSGKTAGSAQIGVDLYDQTVGFVATDNKNALLVPGANNGLSSGQKQCTSVTTSPSCDNTNSNAYTYVNDVLYDTAATPGGTDALKVIMPDSGAHYGRFLASASTYDYEGGASGVNLSGRRIAKLGVDVTIISKVDGPVKLRGVLKIDGVDYGTPYITVPANQGRKTYQFRWSLNPVFGQQWARDDVDLFRTTTSGDNGFGYRVEGASGIGDFYIVGVNLRIVHVDETRIATGYIDAALGWGWREIPLANPTDNLTPVTITKTNGNNLFAALFMTGDGGAADLDQIDAVTTSEQSYLTDWLPGVFGALNGGAPQTIAVPASLAAPAMLLRKSDNSISADSQPYPAVDVYSLHNGVSAALQRFTGVASADYGMFAILVKSTPDGVGGVANDAPLSVTLKRVSDNATVAGPFLIDPDEIPADGKYHVYRGRFATAPTLSNAQSYYLSVTTTSTQNYFLAAPRIRVDSSPGTIDTLAAGVSIGGTAAFATLNGVNDTQYDFPWNIGEVVSTPGSRDLNVGTIDNHLGALSGGAFIANIQYVALTWAATALGVAFGYYEIRRIEEDGSSFTIAKITDESKSYFADFEFKRGAVSGYEIRAVANDGRFSNWGSFGAFFGTSLGCEIICVCNQDPDMALAFIDETPYTWTRPYSAPEIVPIEGRDTPMGFRQTEKSGDVFSRTFVVAFHDPEILGGFVLGGRAMFEPIVNLFEDPTMPCLTVLDSKAWRWFTTAHISNMVEVEPEGSYKVTVEFVETAPSNEPPVLVTNNPWHW